ncbi:hypothetical protein [Demequina soli]|uniref:hypothetical protein n=1 Tax=Demequina soli TaxID=1638987 RepID=UPI000784284C|nr:hypothetical protein [Demequina soli]
MSRGRYRQGPRKSGNLYGRKSSKHLAATPNGRGPLAPKQLEDINRALHREWVFENLNTYRCGHATMIPIAGRPETVNFEAFLTVFAALIELGEAPHLSNVAKTMRFRLSEEDAKWLGIRADVYKLKNDPRGTTMWDLDPEDRETASFAVSPERLYDRVHSAFERMTDLFEPYPGVATLRARPIWEVERDLAALDPADIELKMERLETITNGIVRAAMHRLSRSDRRRFMQFWRGSVAIDGTKVPVHAPKRRGGVPVKLRKEHPDWLHHPEAMAGWYYRDGDHNGFEDDSITPLKNVKPDEKIWAYELTLAVTCANPPKKVKGKMKPNGPVPRFALGMAFGPASANIGKNAMTALLSATQVTDELDIDPGFVVADRAILPNAKAETLQIPARSLGWRQVMEFRKDQNGRMLPESQRKQGGKGKGTGRRGTVASQQGKSDPLRGAIMVDGDVLCPATPQPFIEAEALLKRGKIDEPTRDQRLKEREAYKVTSTERWNKDGRARVACPATTAGGMLNCPLRQMRMDKERTLVQNPPANPGEICTTHQQDLAITLDTNTAKYALDIPYRSPDWFFMMGERNLVESFNAALKEKDHEELEDGGRRPVRGFAKQAVIVSLMVYACNVRTIRRFMYAYAASLPPLPIDGDGANPHGPHAQAIDVEHEDLPPPDRLAA